MLSLLNKGLNCPTLKQHLLTFKTIFTRHPNDVRKIAHHDGEYRSNMRQQQPRCLPERKDRNAQPCTNRHSRKARTVAFSRAPYHCQQKNRRVKALVRAMVRTSVVPLWHDAPAAGITTKRCPRRTNRLIAFLENRIVLVFLRWVLRFVVNE